MTSRAKALLLKLLTPISVLIANVTGFLIYLLLPKLLAPGEFALFSLLMSTSAFGVAFAFEWSRHGLIRFSFVADKDVAARNRATLAQIYRTLVIGVLVVGVVWALVGRGRFGLSEGTALFAAIVSQGLFDGRQAQARARFQNVSFSLAWCIRSFLNIAMAVAAALLLRSGIAAAWAFALSNLLTYLVFNDRFALLREETRPHRGSLMTILHYGMFIAVSSSITALFPVAVRYIPSRALGLTEVAGLMLAFDIGTKAIAMTGLTINLLALQGAISAMEHQGVDAGREKATRQFSLVLTATLPAGLLAVLCQPYVARFIVPASYFQSYMSTVGWAVLAALILTFRTYAIDSVFILARRSVLSVVAPVATIAAMGLATAPLVSWLGNRPATYAQAAVVGAVVGTIVAFLLAQYALRFRIDLPEIGKIVLAAILLSLPFALIMSFTSVWLFLAAAVVGTGLFVGTVLAFDVAGIGQKLRGRH